jgi:hypothetical protein
MSKSITITLPNNVYDTLDRKMGKLATTQVPGMNVSKSAYVTIAIKEKLLRDGEQLVEIKTAPIEPIITAS